MSIVRRKKHKPDFDPNLSKAVDIIIAQFDALNEKLDKILFLNGVHADMNINTYQEHDNDIRVVDMR